MQTTLLETILFSSSESVPLHPEPTGIYIKVFGPLRFYDRDGAIDLRLPGMPRALLAYLFLMRRGVHQRKLAELFWPHGGKSALNSLHQTVYRLRRYLNAHSATADLLHYRDQLYSIDWARPVRVDWHDFKAQVALAQRSCSTDRELPAWLDAYDFCHEPLLEDFSQQAEWAIAFRLQAESLRSLVARRLAGYADEYRVPEVRRLLIQKFGTLSAAS